MTANALETMRSKRQRLVVVGDEFRELPEDAVDVDEE